MAYPWLKKLIIFCAILTIAALSIIAWDVFRLIKEPMLQSGTSSIIITLENQTSAYQFVNRLNRKGLIHSAKLFRILIRVQSLSQHLKAGIYQINPGESAFHFLYRVIDGDVLVEPFTIIEGTTVSQISEKLKTATYLNYNSDDWDAIKQNHPSPEGLLLADTYSYQAGSKSLNLIKQANRELLSYLNYSWENRATDLPYRSAYELLIAASIIEKEAALAEERKLISGVVVNRLKLRMRLQMDPTIIYGLGENYKGKLSRADLAIDSPFNTYKNRGLPPTPIAMVGKSAIDAAAHPTLTHYIYYVAKGDGSHQFSETYSQQKQAVYRYQIKENQ